MFTSIGGESRNYVTALDSSGNDTAWNPSADSEVDATLSSSSHCETTSLTITN